MESIITLKGKFKNNNIIHSKGELSCLTYGIILEKIQGKEGVFNLKQNKHGDYVIFQYYLL